jgi:hypothetical protein
MPSTDTPQHEIDPAEMQSDCAVAVACEGWDVMVEIVKRLNDKG